MAVKKFQTETKKLLDLMINSIYTHKEIFLRELISNASDAIDKRHYLSLTEDKYRPSEDYEIFLDIDKDNRTLTISDNGIGMTYDEVINNLGTIAKSGSKEFIEKLSEEQNKGEIDIIGQFGVGFYSAFMVADKVEVLTKNPLEENAYLFISDGGEEYEIIETTKSVAGTQIKLYLRENNDEEDYDKYLEDLISYESVA